MQVDPHFRMYRKGKKKRFKAKKTFIAHQKKASLPSCYHAVRCCCSTRCPGRACTTWSWVHPAAVEDSSTLFSPLSHCVSNGELPFRSTVVVFPCVQYHALLKRCSKRMLHLPRGVDTGHAVASCILLPHFPIEQHLALATLSVCSSPKRVIRAMRNRCARPWSLQHGTDCKLPRLQPLN